MTEERFSALETDIKEIKNALVGDGFGNHGYKQRLEKVEKHVATQKKRNWIFEGIKATLIAIWGIIVIVWNKLF